MTPPYNSSKCFTALSQLMLCARTPDQPWEERELLPCALADKSFDAVIALHQEDLEHLLELANSHHVVVRSLAPFWQIMAAAKNQQWAEWARNVIEGERARIKDALSFLELIVEALRDGGCAVTVIKSLDHWPDLGSDLDLYTSTDSASVIRIMRQGFNAQLAARSWGDRLANKWNFTLPGLRAAVEVHVGRLGQTGEQVALANSLGAHARLAQLGDRTFQVPAAGDRLMITTLQRMYRHFYIRLCDIADTAQLLETETIDYDDLQSSAQAAGIWEGVATFLTIVSDYVKSYRGNGLALPSCVRASAQFGGDQLRFCRGFLRIPILPHSAKLYASELTRFIRNGEMKNTVRLSLLPCLATAAAMEHKITGSDKGIW